MKVSQSGKLPSQKPSSALMKLALVRTATEKEDPELPLLQRISSLELPASEIAVQINASQSSSNRHISTSSVQRRTRESGLHGWIAAKKQAIDIRSVEICPLVWWVQIWDVWFQPPCLCETQSRMTSACVVPTVKHGGGGVMVWGCFAGDTVCDLYRIQGTLNLHCYLSILQRYAIPSGLGSVGLSLVFQQDNDPTFLQAV